MCSYAGSRDSYYFSPDNMRKVLRIAANHGIHVVRLTGGEPLLHPQIVELLDVVEESGMRSSIITNGYFLPEQIQKLHSSGLKQVIVSIDGLKRTHDKLRQKSGLYDRALAGLVLAAELGLHTRVNTVVGPYNFRDLPFLQEILAKLGIDQWEISALKLDNSEPVKFTSQDLQDLQCTNKILYSSKKWEKRFIPSGEKWCGSTLEEQELFFGAGILPRPDQRCQIVNRVRYIDAKNKRLFPCPFLPHRPGAGDYGVNFDWTDSRASLSNYVIKRVVEYHAKNGHEICTGCSPLAAFLSNGHSNIVQNWAF